MANQAPTRGEVIRAQSQAVGGGRKRCRRGKNCSAACIQAGMVCLVEMPVPAALATTRMRDYLKEWTPKNPYLSPKPSKSVGDYAPIRRLVGEELVNTAWKLAKEGKTPAEIVKATGYWNHDDLFSKAIKEYRPKPAQQRVVGDDLIKLIRGMPSDTSKADLVRAAGYASRKSDGSEHLHFTSFYEALLEAKGIEIDSAGVTKKEFKQAGGYPFRQETTPGKLITAEELQEKLEIPEWAVSTLAPRINKLIKAGASLSDKVEGKPYVYVHGGNLAVAAKIGKNLMKLTVDDEGTVAWYVNDSVDKNKNSGIPAQEKRQMAIAARKSWDILLRSFDEGEILTTTAYTGDGFGESRVKAYKAMGFGEPEDGEAGESQYAKVTRWGLFPLDSVDGRDAYQEQYGRYDDDNDDSEYDNYDRYYRYYDPGRDAMVFRDEDGDVIVDEYGTDMMRQVREEEQEEYSEGSEDVKINEAFMVILFGDAGTEKI